MVKGEEREFFDLLEVDPSCSLEEATRSYYRLKRLYGEESVVVLPLEGEWSEEARRGLVERLDDAYRKVKEILRREKNLWEGGLIPPVREEVEKGVGESLLVDGPCLKRVRVARGRELQDLALVTKLSRSMLQCIEEESYDALPPDAYLRLMVRTLAKELGLPPEKAVSDYLAVRERRQKQKAGNPRK